MPTVRLRAGEYFADLVQDRRDPELWVYVVQREGSTEVLALGTAIGEQATRQLANKILADLAAENGDAATAS